MKRDGEDDIRLRPGRSRDRGQRFVSSVLQQVGKAGQRAFDQVAASPSPFHKRRSQPGSRLGRGHTVSRFAGQHLTRTSRRVAVKALLVNHQRVRPSSLGRHLRYIERGGVGHDGEPGTAFGPTGQAPNVAEFDRACAGDRHHFRFILAPEDGAALGDLRTFTRHFMQQMETDLGTTLEWVAVDHWDTGKPHVHLVLRGRCQDGSDLVIARDYISHGLRARAAELATEWLGQRTDLEIRQSLGRELDVNRFTSLDQTLKDLQDDGLLHVSDLAAPRHAQYRELLLGRLGHLEKLDLARQISPGIWQLNPAMEGTLSDMARHGDIIRTMQKAMGGQHRPMQILTRGQPTISGTVVAKGMLDELADRDGYLIVDGMDGKAHFVPLARDHDVSDYPLGAVVDVKDPGAPNSVDVGILKVVDKEGIYRAEHHLAVIRDRREFGERPEQEVKFYGRRLEALQSAGIVERIEEGVWRIPSDLIEQALQHEGGRSLGAKVQLRSHLSLADQVQANGATWLDVQLLKRSSNPALSGFGADVRAALDARRQVLLSRGLAQRRGTRIVIASNLLRALRERDVGAAASRLAAQTGKKYVPAVDGQAVRGRYQKSILLDSGRFAILEAERTISLVPWRKVIEDRRGEMMRATIRRGLVDFDFSRPRLPRMR